MLKHCYLPCQLLHSHSSLFFFKDLIFNLISFFFKHISGKIFIHKTTCMNEMSQITTSKNIAYHSQ